MSFSFGTNGAESLNPGSLDSGQGASPHSIGRYFSGRDSGYNSTKDTNSGGTTCSNYSGPGVSEPQAIRSSHQRLSGSYDASGTSPAQRYKLERAGLPSSRKDGHLVSSLEKDAVFGSLSSDLLADLDCDLGPDSQDPFVMVMDMDDDL